MSEQPKLWAIYLDQNVTRRKLYHLVVDPAGVKRWHDRYLTGCIEHLVAEGVEEYLLIPSGDLVPVQHCKMQTWKEL